MRRFLPSSAGMLLIGLVAAPHAGAEPLDCVVEPKAIVELGAQDDGRITELLVERGDSLTSGTIVARLDSDLQVLQVDLARLRASSDVAERSEAARVEFRAAELKRATRLTENRAAAVTVLEDARIEHALAELALEETQLARRQAEVELRLAEERLRRREITSPVDGVVYSIDAAVGDLATDREVILQIAEIDPLFVEVFAPAEYYGRIQKGETYRVRAAEPLEISFDAEVRVVDPVFDTASGTFGVRLTVENSKGRIPAGVRCTVDFDNPV